MNLDLGSLLRKTNLKNKKCVQDALENGGYKTVSALDNLPGKYGQPWLCGNGTTVVVTEIRRVIKETSDAVLTIDEAIKVVEPQPEPKKVLTGDTPITSLEIDGVSRGQLKSIKDAGVETLGEFFEAEEKDLVGISGVGKATVDRILQAVTEALEQK